MITNDEWTRYVYTFDTNKDKKVEKVDFDFVMEDMGGELNITDLQFQEGKMVSSHIPHTSEILAPVSFNIDETSFLNTVTNWKVKGPDPVIHQNVTNRFYNIVGRGHQVISIPNVFHEDYTFPIVTSGLDITLRAKEDFDLLRIRTNDGGYIEGGRNYPEDGPLKDHPLNYQYTREFIFDGAKAYEPIELKATLRSAKLNGQNVPLKKHKLNVAGKQMNIDRQRFMLAPAGSFRLGIEFYKKVTEDITVDDITYSNVTYLKDTGIGFYGLAELNQWTFGGSKL